MLVTIIIELKYIEEGLTGFLSFPRWFFKNLLSIPIMNHYLWFTTELSQNGTLLTICGHFEYLGLNFYPMSGKNTLMTSSHKCI